MTETGSHLTDVILDVLLHFQTSCTSTVRGVEHKPHFTANLFWELNFQLTPILKVARLGRTTLFNANPDAPKARNGQRHLNRVFGPSKIPVRGDSGRFSL